MRSAYQFRIISVHNSTNKVKTTTIAIATIGTLVHALLCTASTAHAQQELVSAARAGSVSSEVASNGSDGSSIMVDVANSNEVEGSAVAGYADDANATVAGDDIQVSSKAEQESDLVTIDGATSDQSTTIAEPLTPSHSSDEPQQDATVDTTETMKIPQGYSAGWQLIDGKWYCFSRRKPASWLQVSGSTTDRLIIS